MKTLETKDSFSIGTLETIEEIWERIDSRVEALSNPAKWEHAARMNELIESGMTEWIAAWKALRELSR
jgi:hypothetical protein